MSCYLFFGDSHRLPSGGYNKTSETKRTGFHGSLMEAVFEKSRCGMRHSISDCKTFFSTHIKTRKRLCNHALSPNSGNAQLLVRFVNGIFREHRLDKKSPLQTTVTIPYAYAILLFISKKYELHVMTSTASMPFVSPFLNNLCLES